MSQAKDLVRAIKKGKELEKNLPIYRNRLFDIYHQVSLLHVTMDYFVLYETLQEKSGKENGYLADTISEINQVIQTIFIDGISSEEEKKEQIAKILSARDEVIRMMKILTMYTDKLQIYEHVVNRMELKYENHMELADIDTFVQKVYQYIFSGKDNVVINENIKEVLAELPVRMARSKYFQMIENSMSVYKDADKSALDRFVYMLETSAMLYEPEGVGEYFLDIKEFSDRLGKMCFSAMSEAEFRMVYDELQEKAEFIEEVADLYVSIQGLLNSLYCYETSFQGQEHEKESEQACLAIIKGVNQLFAEGNWADIPQEIQEKLVLTEGKQESLVEEMMQLEAGLMDIQMGQEEKLEQLGMLEDFDKLDAMQQLLAASGTFVEFEEEAVEETADEAYVMEETAKLLEKLKVQFAENEMCVNRAVIAATISKFPVFFTSSKEVEEYIRESLERCQDDAERQASMNVIQAIMEA